LHDLVKLCSVQWALAQAASGLVTDVPTVTSELDIDHVLHPCMQKSLLNSDMCPDACTLMPQPNSLPASH
jgi:hypothetical protein